MTDWRLPEDWRPKHPIFAFHEDSNANAVLITPEGNLYAVAEERLTRTRFQAGFPARSLQWLESVSGISLASAEVLVFGNRTHFLPRILGNHFPTFEHDMFGFSHKLMLAYHHLCFLSPGFTGLMEGVNRALLWLRFRKPVRIVDHHFAHAASAYYTSGRTDACAVSVDNFGDGYAAKVFDCEGSQIRFIRGSTSLRSPGQFYAEIAQLAGIHPLHAGKLTGMSASGDPKPGREAMQELFGTEDDDRDFRSTYGWGRSAGGGAYLALRSLAKPDLAAAAQKRFEEVVVRYTLQAARETGRRHLVLAGGCFANVRVNQFLLESPDIDSVYIHPAMTDQGIAMGAALAAIAEEKHGLPFVFENVLLGPAPTESEMERALRDFGLAFERPDDLADRAAALLAEGRIIARFDGPMEYGLRALGNRSILHHGRDPDLQQWMNRKLQRASYMPFAPVTLAEHADRCYKNLEGGRLAARFMTVSFDATDWMKRTCPGVVHVDGTVRPQLLSRGDNPGMYELLTRYHELTGIPCLMNTSFNMHSEPIVASARDACQAFVNASLDYLILGPFLARLSAQE